MKDNFQIPIINNLRGIAALLVCLFHFIYSTKNFISNQYVLNIFYFGQFGVHLFFVISGIVIPLSLLKCNYTILKFPTFFFKRIIRIEPTYLVAVGVAILILVVKRNIVNLSFPQIALHIGYLIPFYLAKYSWLNEVFWTLAIEFQYYLFISVLILLIVKNNFFGRLLFYFSLLILPFLYNNPNFFPMYAPLFLMGCVWCLLYLKKINNFEFFCVLIISTLISVFKTGVIETIAGCLSIGIIYFFQNYSNKILNLLGNISYSLYLFHTLIGGSCVNILSQHFKANWQKPIVVIVGIAVSIFSAYIVYYFIEKPTQTLSKKIKY